MIEIWMRDEYGQASIQGRVADYDKAIARSYEILESTNIDNALTSAEKDRNWECYLPTSTDHPSLMYGGKVRGTVDFFFDPVSGEIKESKSAKILLGKRNGKMWHAIDHKNAELSSLDDNGLKNKAYIFFKKV